MKRIAPLFLLLVLVGTVIAKTMTSGDSSSLAKANQLLLEVAKAYQEAPALTDDISIDISEQRGDTSLTLELALAGKREGFFSYDDWKFYAFDSTLFITRDAYPGKYIRHDLEGSFLETVISSTNANFLVPHFELLNGDSLQDYVKGFSLGQMSDLRLVGLDTVDRDNRKVSRLTFESSKGKAFAFINNTTRLIDSMEVEVELQFGSVNIAMTMKPKVRDELDKTITLDISSSRAVENFKLSVGDMAPDFELETLEGEVVRLSDLRGSMVVLDFWATWCGPCVKGLPLLDRFNQWAKSTNQPVHVLGIDSFERPPTEALKRAQIERFWKVKGFSFSTLLDFDQSTMRSYEVGPIPHGVVIDTEGRIFKIHIGYDRGMFERLKQEAQEILNEKG